MMRGFIPALSLQVWATLMLLSRLHGKVIAPLHLEAVAGLPFKMGCNITMEKGEALKQVLWLDMANKTLLHYQPEKYDHVTKVEGVELTAQVISQLAHTSIITFNKAGPASEGCYQCLFDVYPTGQQKGRTCLSLMAKVEMVGNKTVVSGKTVNFSCKYIFNKRVQQVLWTKTAEQGDTVTVASYYKNGRPIIKTPFQGRLTLNPSLDQTQLSIQQAQTEDEGCYTCEFHTYPDGTKSATACLSVYVLPKPEGSITVSQDNVEANCTAVSRPAAEIFWNVEGHNQTLGPSVTSFYQLGDGTTMVVSSIQLRSELLDEELIKCEVHHQGLGSPIFIYLNKSRMLGYVVLISASCVALVLLICLCICLKRC